MTQYTAFELLLLKTCIHQNKNLKEKICHLLVTVCLVGDQIQIDSYKNLNFIIS